MKRTYIPIACTLAGAVSVATIASANSNPPTGRTAAVTRVQLRNTARGRILVNGSGSTLYRFTKDPRNRDMCVRISGCSAIWPALTTRGKPKAGKGVKASRLSTIKLPRGARQVTYYGHPLYLYAPAREPGQTYYIGVIQFGGTWDGLNARGNTVR